MATAHFVDHAKSKAFEGKVGVETTRHLVLISVTSEDGTLVEISLNAREASRLYENIKPRF